jgi:hypothetical protein
MNKTWDGKRCDMCGGHRGNDRKESMFCPDCKEQMDKCSTLWTTASKTIVGIKSGK